MSRRSAALFEFQDSVKKLLLNAMHSGRSPYLGIERMTYSYSSITIYLLVILSE